MGISKKNILVAPLNWGLGHATRCIPIIRELEKNGFNPIIASDGASLELLQKEFPHLQSLEFPSYGIEYPKNSADFKWKLIKNSPKIIKAIFLENKLINKLEEELNLIGIISDNRLGVYSHKIPCVYITHQLTVLSGNTTLLSTKLHQYFIKKFTECWVPDSKGSENLSGKLGHLDKHSLDIKYISPLSRFEKRELPKKYDLLIVLSGPEPQRTLLEEKLILEIENYQGEVLFVKGVLAKDQKIEKRMYVTFYNFMTSTELETAFNESEIVLCRSGYTTIMDLSKLNKKAFFIPTPGQYEQKYLARRLKRNGFAPFARQDDFKIKNLEEIKLYRGLPELNNKVNWKDLFELFESK